MHILYYISSHGYGHGVRSCAIGNCFSEQVTLTLRTMLPEKFFEEELTRPFTYTQGTFDCGCIQSDSITVDIRKTLYTYMKIADRNEAVLDAEAAWCRDRNVSGIVTDIAPFPCEVAKRAGVPCIAVSNFSWHDIYEPYLSDVPEFKPYFDKITEQYLMTDLLLGLTPTNAMRCFNRRKEMPVVGRVGTDRKREIKSFYGIATDKKIGLIYTGDFGMDSVCWKELETLTEWEFIGVYPLPGSPANFHHIDKANFPYQDLSASTDVMITKIGYGVYSECLCNGVPLIYVPRENFAEHPVLEEAILEWGHGYRIPPDDFYSLTWQPALQKIENDMPPEKIKSVGAQECAREIEMFFDDYRNGSSGIPVG